MKYVIAYDLGTTGNKATLYGIDEKLLASSSQVTRPIIPVRIR